MGPLIPERRGEEEELDVEQIGPLDQMQVMWFRKEVVEGGSSQLSRWW